MKRTNEQCQEVAESITFGIEIECYVKEESRDFDIRRYGYSVFGEELPNFPGWKTTYDSSLSNPVGLERTIPVLNSTEQAIKFANKEGFYMPVEIISPILRGKKDLEQAMKVAETLKKKYSALIKKDCGFHVHIGIPDCIKTEKQEIIKWVRNLISWVGTYELGFYASTGTLNRVNNRFCAPINGNYTTEEFTGAKWDKVIQKYSNHMERYKVLNIVPLIEGKQNIEFRVFQGTVEPIKIAAYIQVCIGFAIKSLISGKKTIKVIKPRFYNKDAGIMSIFQMLNTLGWRNNSGKKYTFLGFLLDTKKFIKPIRAELNRLAQKFDKGVHINTLPNTKEVLEKLGYWS